MDLTALKLKEVFPEFNERAHDANDFWRVAKKEKIRVKEEPLLIDGYYQVKNNKPVILINSDLSLVDWLITAFHELVHHLLDVPYKKCSVLLYRDAQKLNSMQEQRAEDISLILLVPQAKLKELEHTPFDQLHPYNQKILIKRKGVFERHGI